jgi:hypothetical protein
MRGPKEAPAVVALLAVTLLANTVSASPITYSTSPAQIGAILFDHPDLVVTSAVASGTADYGTFTDSAPAPAFFAGGVYLSSGTAACIPGPNQFDSCTDSIQAIYAQLDFSVTAAQAVDLTIHYKFGSEEFPEYAIPLFSDRFDLVVNGDNVAKLQPGDLLVDVGNLYTSGQYVLNPLDSPDTELDGYSILLSVIVPLQAGANTVSIRVADVGAVEGDYQYDSAVFIAGAVIPPAPEIPEPATTFLVGAGLLLVGWRIRSRR